MEATTKHTPGPWTVESASSPVIVTEQKHPSSRRKGMRQAVATVCDGWGDEEPLNALLIAAAPDVLAALELVLPILVSDIGQLDASPVDLEAAQRNLARCKDIIRAAIAKAEGQ